MIGIDINMPKSCYDCLFAEDITNNDYGAFAKCMILHDMADGNDEIDYRINLLTHEKNPICPLQRIVRCKNCSYFKYDHVMNIDGVPLIAAHEICTKWGDGCKTSENGFCFLGKEKEVSK